MFDITKHYNAIAPKLTNYLAANGLDYHTACDIVQETFRRMWKMRDDIVDDDAQISGLAYTIARNLRTSHYRADKHIVFQEEIRDEDAGSTGPAASPSDAEYLRGRINAALAKLPPLLREAYTLFQISELSVKQISYQTGASESLVKVRVHRAKLQLRELLKDLV